MKLFRNLVIGTALMGAIALPAFAEGDGGGSLSRTQAAEDTLMSVSPTGTVVQKKMTTAQMTDMMSKDAMPMTAGAMMMMHNGKMYMIPDKKMSDGKMLSQTMMGM